MNDVWNNLEKEFIERKHKTKIITGMYVFRLVNKEPSIKRVNDYAKATDKYKKNVLLNDTCKREYIIHPTVVRALYWNGKPFEGNLLKIEVSDSVYIAMGELYVRLKRAKYCTGDIIIYWKPTKAMVRFAFVTEEIWDVLKHVIYKRDIKMLHDKIYWYGRKERFNEDAFNAFYGWITNQEQGGKQDEKHNMVQEQ